MRCDVWRGYYSETADLPGGWECEPQWVAAAASLTAALSAQGLCPFALLLQRASRIIRDRMSLGGETDS